MHLTSLATLAATAVPLLLLPLISFAAETDTPPRVPARDLSSFFAKIRSGKGVVVMGIGGSVTVENSWAAMSAEWLRKQYPGSQIAYIDAAYGGTPPWQTVFRMRRDILPHKPDLVFIEYSVNSYMDNERNWLAQDGMIQQLLRQPQKPDIVFVYVGTDTGHRDLIKVQPVAQHYGFPEVDVWAHLKSKMDAGEVKWTDVAGDAIHPNPKGHAIYAQAVQNLLATEAAKEKSSAQQSLETPPIPPPFFGDEFTTATLLPIAAAQTSSEWRAVRPPGWTDKFFDEVYETDQPGATLTVKANTTAFGIYILQTTDSGQIAWSIDDGPEKVEDVWAGYLEKDAFYVRNMLLAHGLPRGDHVLKLRVLPKSEKAEGNRVRIGGFCVTNPKPSDPR